MRLQVELIGKLERAPALLQRLQTAGAREVVGYSPVPMRGADGAAETVILTVEVDTLAQANVIRRLPDVIEVYPDVEIAPFGS